MNMMTHEYEEIIWSINDKNNNEYFQSLTIFGQCYHNLGRIIIFNEYTLWELSDW